MITNHKKPEQTIVSGVNPFFRPCPLCGARQGKLIEPLRFVPFDGSAITGNCDLVACLGCGFAFYDTLSSQADFDRYYQQNSYYYTANSTGTGGLGGSDCKRFEDLINRIAPLIANSQAAIFDVGCAKGGLLNVLAQKGYLNVYGVDMLAECVQHVRRSLTLSADIGSALNLPFAEVSADVLIYSHIVEHVIDLSALVEAARAKLNDNGFIYVEVPDASQYGRFSSNPYQDLYLEHVNHFSLETLIALFANGGFVAVKTGRFELAATGGSVCCAWGIFRKGETKLPKPDSSLATHLIDYVSWSRNHPVHMLYSQLSQLKKPLYLWGISQYAMLLLGQTPLSSCPLGGLVDKDPSKKRRTLAGYPIQSPDILGAAGSDHTVIVTALGYEEAIVGELAEMNFTGRIVTAFGRQWRLASGVMT